MKAAVENNVLKPGLRFIWTKRKRSGASELMDDPPAVRDY